MSTAPSPPPPPRTVRKLVLLGGAAATLVGAVVVFCVGVVWTTGVYGSRMAWLFGVAIPLLVLTAGFAWLASPQTPRQGSAASHPGPPRRWISSARSHVPGVPKSGAPRTLFIISAVLVATPVALVVALLGVYTMIFVVYGLRTLFH